MKLVINSDAQEDILKAARFYEKQERGLGARVVLFLREKMLQLTTVPGIHPMRWGFYQAVVDGDFPYYVIYHTLEQNALRVRAVFDHRRDPKRIRRWLSKR
ncbi:MAG: type II toxin-antitoxin system RelE/ParE family toxin [Prosthecobacter sp.]